MEKTLDEWVAFLTARMDTERPRIDRLRSYVNGKGPLPEMGPNLKKSWEAFQRRARANPAKMVAGALSERIRVNGITVGDKSDTQPVAIARRIWRDNRMGVSVPDAIWDACVLGVGYLLSSIGDDGHAVITRERPETFYAEPDPIRPWRPIACAKTWRDEVAGLDHLVVWAGGVKAEYTRDCWEASPYRARQLIKTVSGHWDLQPDSLEFYDGAPPATILENKERQGEFEPHLDLIDRINWGILQRLVIVAMQAFRQRALKRTGEDAAGPEEDEEEDDTDLQALFEPGPGALWELPAGWEIWESQQTSIGEILNATKDDWRELAAETSTPLSIMLPDAANQSASGAEAPQRQLVAKAEDRIERWKPALAVLIVKALQIEGVDLADETVEVLFEPPHAVSLTEKYAAAQQARSAGEALETIQRNILGYSPEQVAQDKQRRAEEQMALAMNLTQPGATGAEQAAQTQAEASTGDDADAMRAKFDALGVAIRAGVDPQNAARILGLEGVEFTGAVPVSLRMPESQAADLEDA